MTAIAGVVGGRLRTDLERECVASIAAQSLYAMRLPKVVTVDGASFAAAPFPTTPEDLTDQQPLAAAPILLVGDARIDNRTELIESLGHPRLTATSSDTDLLLAGWVKWNYGLLARLTGSFALAVFDGASRTVVLARGPNGDRPLCYRLSADGLSFASMPSGLVDASTIAFNLPGLARTLVHGDVALGETSFAGVRTVPPAHYLNWTANGHRLVRYWDPPTVDPTKTGEVVEEFNDILRESVACRLRRIAGPIATHLSSGFDSSAVTATAAALVRDRRELIAYTMAPAPGLPLCVPPGRAADETAIASQVAAMLGLDHHVVSESAPLLESLRGHARYFQAPVPNVPNHGWGQAIDAAAAAAGARVLLSATLGNATISFGAIDLLSEWLRQRRYVHYLRQARALVKTGAARWRGALFYSSRDLVPPRLWSRLAGFPPSPADALFIRAPWMIKVKNDVIGSPLQLPGLRYDQYSIFARSDPGLFTKGTLGKSGLDERDPAGDRRLVEFCLRLPAEQYLDGGVTKRLARRALADRLPPSIVHNKMRGYQGADWFAKLSPRSANEWIEEIAASSCAGDLLDLPSLRRAVTNWQEIANLPPIAQRQWGRRFTSAMAVGAFLREVECNGALLGRKC